MKQIPKVLVDELVEVALDQPSPTARLQEVLQKVLIVGVHPNRWLKRPSNGRKRSK